MNNAIMADVEETTDEALRGLGPQKRIPVVEMFGPTIQGEGAMAGVQTYFIRFGLCDYKCTMCDSMHAVDPKSVRKFAKFLTQEEISQTFVHDVYKSNTTKWITFSGGNPAIHELGYLVDSLHALGFMISVETQGTKYPEWLDDVDNVTVSPKGPGMGEKFEPDVFIKFLNDAQHHEECGTLFPKIVIFDQQDIDFAVQIKTEFLSKHTRLFEEGLPLYLSLGNHIPPDNEGESDVIPAEHNQMLLAQYRILSDEVMQNRFLNDAIFLPQIHLLVYGNKKGH